MWNQATSERAFSDCITLGPNPSVTFIYILNCVRKCVCGVVFVGWLEVKMPIAGPIATRIDHQENRKQP